MEEMNQIENILLHYLQGSISEDEMRELNFWLAESRENKQLFFELKNLYELRKGGLYPDKDEIALSFQRLQKKMDAAETFENASTTVNNPTKIEHSSNMKYRLTGLLKYAAVAIIFILLTIGFQKFIIKDSLLTYTELDVESGPRMSRLILPDGTKVVLNASTKFKFPDKFDGDVREVFLDGEAFFDVTHNEKSPFSVITGKQKITALGTAFNVMDYSTDDYAITTLVSGSVTVQSISETQEPEKVYRLKPSQQAFFNKSSTEITLNNVKIDPTRTWVNKIYHFRDEPLLTITQRLEKFYGLKIIITDEAMKYEKCTGTFPTNLEIDEILKIINFDKQFTYTIKDETVIISSKPSKTKMPMEKK